jgi:hypothetical protein
MLKPLPRQFPLAVALALASSHAGAREPALAKLNRISTLAGSRAPAPRLAPGF